MLRRIGHQAVICFVGGGARNAALAHALEESLNTQVFIPGQPQIVVALGAALVAAMRKWPTGMFVAWYPVKDRTTLAPLFAALDGAGFDGIVAEFIRHEEDGLRFAGSGLVILNPPWQFETTAAALQAELREALGAPAQKPVRRLRV